VDPDIEHPQITDYVHVFDPWGNALGEDVGGRQCTYGSTDLLDSRAYKYCERVFGYSGPTLIVADGGVFIPGGAESTASIDFTKCRLFTHIIETMVVDLEREGVIKLNGDTDIGCLDQFERNHPACPVPGAFKCSRLFYGGPRCYFDTYVWCRRNKMFSGIPKSRHF
jgi:hypothetical protein